MGDWAVAGNHGAKPPRLVRRRHRYDRDPRTDRCLHCGLPSANRHHREEGEEE